MDHFEDRIVGEGNESLKLPFDKEPNSAEMPELEDFATAHPTEESIYQDDLIRVYLREMGAVRLLSREGELNLARHMERGKLRIQKALSRSPQVQLRAVEIADQIKSKAEDLDAFIDLGDLEEKSTVYAKRHAKINKDLGACPRNTFRGCI